MSARDEKERQPEPSDELEGEGNKTADRKYREGLEEFQKTHDVERLAEEARQDVERNPEEFEEARRESLEHIAEEDPEVSVPLEHHVHGSEAPVDEEQEEGADFRDTRAGVSPPPEVQREEKAPEQKEGRKAA